MIAPTLGADPGEKAGGGVLLASDGRTVIAAWSWRRLTDRYEVHTLGPDGTLRVTSAPSIHAIAVEMRETAGALGVPWALVVEGLFAWKEQTNGIIELAEATGALVGPLAECAAVVHRPRAVSWRSVVLPRGWGRTSEEAERSAGGLCRATMPSLGGFLAVDLSVAPDKSGQRPPLWPHVVEAACMARWGWVQQRAPAQTDLIGERSSGRGR